MSILDVLQDPSAKRHREAPANPVAIQEPAAESKVELPVAYLTCTSNRRRFQGIHLAPGTRVG